MAVFVKKNNVDKPLKYLEEGRNINEEPEEADETIDKRMLDNDAILNNHTAEAQPERTSCWEQTVDNVIRFRNKTTTFRLIYVIVLAVALSLLIALVFMFIPLAKDNRNISDHLEQTSLLVRDCRENTDFLRSKSDELQAKLQSCDKGYQDLSALLKDKTAKMDALQARAESLQSQIWDLNAEIMAKNNKIFQLGLKPETGFFGTIASLFSAGSAVVPSYQVIAGVILFIFLTAA